MTAAPSLPSVLATLTPAGDAFTLDAPAGWGQGRTLYGGMTAALCWAAAARAHPALPPLRPPLLPSRSREGRGVGRSSSYSGAAKKGRRTRPNPSLEGRGKQGKQGKARASVLRPPTCATDRAMTATSPNLPSSCARTAQIRAPRRASAENRIPTAIGITQTQLPPFSAIPALAATKSCRGKVGRPPELSEPLPRRKARA